MAGDNSLDARSDRGSMGFLTAGSRDLEQAERLVEEALLAGAEEAEVYLKSSTTTSIILKGGFSTLAGGSERGLALRVFDGKGCMGHAFASWSGPEVGHRVVSHAMASLEASSSPPIVPRHPAPRPSEPFADIAGVLDAEVLESGPAEKRASIETGMRQAHRQAALRLGVAYRDGVSRVVIANSRGLQASFSRTLALLTLTLSGAGRPTLHAEAAACGLRQDSIRDNTENLLRLDGSEPEREIRPEILLLESSAATGLVRWIEREVFTDPESLSSPERFRRLASETVEVVDDPWLPGGLASGPFDGEGHPTAPVKTVKAGIPVARLGDGKSALGESGHSVRASYRDLPAPGGSNLLILGGRRSREEILHGVEAGLFVAALESDSRGEHREREACWRGIGWRIRNGRLEGACHGFLFRAAPGLLLSRILEVSRDVRFSLRGTTALGSPDLLIRLED